MTCPICAARVPRKPRRPGLIPQALGFNKVVGCDLLAVTFLVQAVVFLNMICWGIGYKMVAEVATKESEKVTEAFAQAG